MGQVQPGRRQELLHLSGPAHRAFDEQILLLPLEILGGGEPALELVLLLAAKIEDFQTGLRSLRIARTAVLLQMAVDLHGALQGIHPGLALGRGHQLPQLGAVGIQTLTGRFIGRKGLLHIHELIAVLAQIGAHPGGQLIGRHAKGGLQGRLLQTARLGTADGVFLAQA